jgi:hypothetical protein
MYSDNARHGFAQSFSQSIYWHKMTISTAPWKSFCLIRPLSSQLHRAAFWTESNSGGFDRRRGMPQHWL